MKQLVVGGWLRWGWLAPWVLMLAACAPTYNWRLVSHDGVVGRMLLPCKPERAEREGRLLGPDQPPLPIKLMSCRSGGHTFAWAVMPLPPGVAPPLAADAWMRASWASLRQAVPSQASSPEGWSSNMAAVSGAEWSQRWRGPALDHRQQPLDAHLIVAVHGGWLHQAAVYAPPASANASVIDTFFESLTLR